MNRYVIYQPNTGRMHTADTLCDLAFATGKIEFSVEQRKVYVNGQPDSMSWTEEFRGEDLWREFGLRALELLGRRGWVLYEKVKP